MKKNPSSKITFSFSFSFAFILLFILNISSQSNNPAQSEIWTQPFKQCWEYPSEKIIGSQIASDNEMLFVPFISGNVSTLSIKSGKPIWNTELGGEIASTIISGEKNIYLLNEIEKLEETDVDTKDTKDTSKPKTQTTILLRSLDAAIGITNWKKSFNLAAKTNLYLRENLLILVAENGYIAAINQNDGSIIWELATKREILATSQPTETIAIGTSDKKILLISTSNGTITKELDIKEIPVSILLSNNEQLFWGDKKGSLNNLNITSGTSSWRRRFGGNITNLEETAKGLFVSSIDNFTYLINKTTGKIIWKRRLAGKVTEKPFIRDNIAIAFAFGDSSALFIELNKGRIINSLTLSDANYFVSSPFYSEKLLVFPTLKGLYAFGVDCEKKEKTGE
jgi:outer membrane protein assembly factor BamB